MDMHLIDSNKKNLIFADQKKTPHSLIETAFFGVNRKQINVWRIVVSYEPCAGPLSYAQLHEHHELQSRLYAVLA
jgi:hypothetical protein